MKGRIWLHVVRIEIQSLVSRKKVSVREMIKEYAYIYIYIKPIIHACGFKEY